MRRSKKKVLLRHKAKWPTHDWVSCTYSSVVCQTCWLRLTVAQREGKAEVPTCREMQNLKSVEKVMNE